MREQIYVPAKANQYVMKVYSQIQKILVGRKADRHSKSHHYYFLSHLFICTYVNFTSHFIYVRKSYGAKRI